MILDSDLLRLIDVGEIVVAMDNPETIAVAGRTIKAYEIGHGRNRTASHTRYAFGIRYGGHRRTIVRSKLVYMAGSRRLVPDGFEIHHLDGDRYNDAWENLVMFHRDDHRKIHSAEDEAETIDFLRR